MATIQALLKIIDQWLIVHNALTPSENDILLVQYKQKILDQIKKKN